jgi:hypothetical protein
VRRTPWTIGNWQLAIGNVQLVKVMVAAVHKPLLARLLASEISMVCSLKGCQHQIVARTAKSRASISGAVQILGTLHHIQGGDNTHLPVAE